MSINLRLVTLIALCCVSILSQGQDVLEFLNGPEVVFPGYGQDVMTVGDFNGDGKLDTVSAGNDVYVLLSNGDGTFQSPKQTIFRGQAISASVGDFNQDGKLDLVLADYIDTVSVFLGNGDGTFQNNVNYAVGKHPDSVAVADFNGDGTLDLAVSDGAIVNLLFGNGNGTFQAAVPLAAGTRPLNVMTADFNGDFKPDLALTINGDKVGIFLGNGNGTFQTRVDYGVISASHLIFADLNDDKNLDVLLPCGIAGICVLTGNGDGTFQQYTLVSTSFAVYDVVAGDFNNDGSTDIVAIAGSNAGLLLGNGDGTFRPESDWGLGPYSPFFGVGKFNGDGTDDLAVLSYTKLILLEGNRDGTFRDRSMYLIGDVSGAHGYLAATAATDLNNDGISDLIATGSTPNGPAVQTMLSNGDGSFQPHQDVLLANSLILLVVDDFNGDGNMDLAGEGLQAISVLLGKGDGSFQAPVDYPTDDQQYFVHGFASGDIDGDHKPDLVFINQVQHVFTVMQGQGDGTFHPVANIPIDMWPGGLAIADVNGDGKADVILGASDTTNYTSAIGVFLGNGNFTFRPERHFATSYSTQGVAVADLNKDGKLDVVTANYNAATVSVLLGNGDGTFRANMDFPAGENLQTPMDVKIADFNADGTLDLAVTEGYEGTQVGVLLGTGDGHFLPETRQSLGSVPTGIAIADFNRDGGLDIAVPAAWVNLLWNTGGTQAALKSSANPSHVGDPVTFMASFKASFHGIGTPSGKVQFNDGTNILGTAVLQSGQASLTISSLAAGNHSIRAIYLGNQQFNRHKSDALVQKVLP